MWPGTVRLGPLAFTAYDAMRFSAAVAAISLAAVVNGRRGISGRVTLGIAVVCVPFSILASWLLDAVEYAPTLGAVGDQLQRHGSSIFGGLFASFATAWVLATTWGVPPLRFLDGGAPAIAVGEAITRLGCFCAGCCYGVPWNGPWAVVFPPGSFAVMDQKRRGMLPVFAHESLPVHPVQLYGAAVMLGVAIALVRRLRRSPPDGDAFFRLLIAYGAYRLGMGALRTEALASMKVFAVVFVLAGAAGLWWCATTAAATPEPTGATAR